MTASSCRMKPKMIKCQCVPCTYWCSTDFERNKNDQNKLIKPVEADVEVDTGSKDEGTSSEGEDEGSRVTGISWEGNSSLTGTSPVVK